LVIRRTTGGMEKRTTMRGKYLPRKKVCRFCVDNIREINYKESAKLSRYISDRGKIEPRRRTGTCAKHQRALAKAIKRARFIALLPYVVEHIRIAGNVASIGPAPVKDKEKQKEAPEVAEESVKAEETKEKVKGVTKEAVKVEEKIEKPKKTEKDSKKEEKKESKKKETSQQ